MRRSVAATVLILTITGGSVLWAQSNPLSESVTRDYKRVRDYFIRAAEKMPEENYGFKPSPDVRSFGQQVAHVADDQYNLCAPAKGDRQPSWFQSHKFERRQVQEVFLKTAC